MDITIWMDTSICTDALSCSNRRAGCTDPHSWNCLLGRPDVSPASETAAGFEEHKGLLHRGRTGKHPTPWCKSPKQPPRAARGMAASDHGSIGDLLVFLTLLGTSFPMPACYQPSKTMENSTKGQILFLHCPAVPRRVWAGWPRGGRTLPCHSAAHYCFSMSQYTDWVIGNYIAFIFISTITVLRS